MDRKVDQRADYTDYSFLYDAAASARRNYWHDNNGNPLARPARSTSSATTASQGEQRARASPRRPRRPLPLHRRRLPGAAGALDHPGLPDPRPRLRRSRCTGWPGTIWLTDQNARRPRRRRVRRGVLRHHPAADAHRRHPRLLRTTTRLYGFFGFGEGYNRSPATLRHGRHGSELPGRQAWKNAPCVNLDKGVSGTGETHKVNLNYNDRRPTRMVYATYSTGYRPGGNQPQRQLRRPIRPTI